MANTVVVSTADPSMDDLALWMQAASGDAAISYSAQAWRTELDALFSAEGVLNTAGGAFRVSQRAAGANFSIDVAAGRAILAGDNIANQGKYLVRSVGVVNVTTPVAPASGTRVHRIILRIRDKQAVGSGTYDWTIELLEDTGTGTPTEPASAITLATVSITLGQASVLDANIIDYRAPAQSASSPHLFVRRTTDSTGIASNTTMQDDTQLFVTVPPNSMWHVNANIFYDSGTVGDYKIGWSAPAGATFDWSAAGQAFDQNGLTGTMVNVGRTIADVEAVAGAGPGNRLTARPSGLLIVGATPGQFRHRWAQGASDTTGTSNKAGSYLLLTRVG